MEIIKEINYDWMWKFGLALIGIGIISFIIFIIFERELSAIGIPALLIGIVFLVVGIVSLNRPRFRIKLCDTYTVYELIEQCESVEYESDYGTWLVRFKQEEDQNGNNEQ